MLEGATGWFKAFLVTLFNTGIRTGEALALQWGDIDFENNTITIQRTQRHGVLKETKTNIINVLYMPTPVKEALQLHGQTAKSSLWVFPNENTLQPYFESRPIVKSYFKPPLRAFKHTLQNSLCHSPQLCKFYCREEYAYHTCPKVFGAY